MIFAQTAVSLNISLDMYFSKQLLRKLLPLVCGDIGTSNLQLYSSEFTLVLTKYPLGTMTAEHYTIILGEAILMWVLCECSADDVQV